MLPSGDVGERFLDDGVGRRRRETPLQTVQSARTVLNLRVAAA